MFKMVWIVHLSGNRMTCFKKHLEKQLYNMCILSGIFATNLDEMLHDQLEENVASHHIWKWLLLKTDLTLNKANTISTQIEAAGEKVTTILDQSQVPVQAMQEKAKAAVSRYRYKYSASASFLRGGRLPPLRLKMNSSAHACYPCWSTKHLVNDSRCSAVFSNCQKIGHFSRACRSQQMYSSWDWIAWTPNSLHAWCVNC